MNLFRGRSFLQLLICVGLAIGSVQANASELTDVSKASEIEINFHLVWIGICTILVLFMQAGFLMLEGGMVRSCLLYTSDAADD